MIGEIAAHPFAGYPGLEHDGRLSSALSHSCNAHMNVRVGTAWSDQVFDFKLERGIAIDLLFLGHYSMEDGLEYLGQHL
jgi:hypothetical protein